MRGHGRGCLCLTPFSPVSSSGGGGAAVRREAAGPLARKGLEGSADFAEQNPPSLGRTAKAGAKRSPAKPDP
jgi:hypothetical protein